MTRFSSESWVSAALVVAETADELSQKAESVVPALADVDRTGAKVAPTTLIDDAFAEAAQAVAEQVQACLSAVIDGLIEISVGLDGTGKSYRETEMANVQDAQRLQQALAHTPFNGG